MDQNTTEPRSRIDSQSVFANVLSLSGYVGLAVGFSLEFYRLYLLDSALGVGSTPEWLALSRFSLLIGSVVVLVYARALDDVFEGWLDLVILCLLAGQWGVPAWAYVDSTIGGPGSPYGFLIIACAGLYALVAIITAVNYARRCWPSVYGTSTHKSD